MDRLNAMQLFVRVAELGSFAAVATQMGVAPSVVTRQIGGLEKHLGIKLMERSTRRLRLTSAGTAYLEKSRVILNLVEAAETGIAEERQMPRGYIRIAMPLVFGTKRVAPLLLEFAGAYPEVQLDMDYSDRRQNLIEEGIDLSIRITNQLGPTDIARKLNVSHMKVVASESYLKRHGTPKVPSDLSHHEFLGYLNSPLGTLPFQTGRRIENVPVRSRVNSNNGVVLAEAAARGIGITCSPDFLVDEFIAAGRLVQILAEYPMPELGIYAMLPSNRQVPHRVRVLMEFLAEKLGAGAGADTPPG